MKMFANNGKGHAMQVVLVSFGTVHKDILMFFKGPKWSMRPIERLYLKMLSCLWE